MTKTHSTSASLTALIIFGSVSLVASPAFARDNQPYVELGVGLTKVEKTVLNIGTTVAGASVDYNTGYDFGGIVGYDFGMFRVEAEASTRKAEPKLLTSAVRLPNGAPISSTNPGLAGNFVDAAGNAQSQSLMANAMIDLGKDDAVQFFVGGGAGIAKVKYRYSINPAGPAWLDGNGSGSKFAWQAIAGLRAPISDKFDVGLKYRFFNVGGRRLVDTGGRAVDPRNFASHSLMASVGFNF